MINDVDDRVGPRLTEHRGRAMGSDLHILITDVGGRRDPGRILSACRREVDRLEGLWSRFLAGSEISALNHAGGPRLVSPDTLELIERSIEAWHRTGGRFDPTVLHDLSASGYDRDYAQVTRSTVRVSGDRQRARGRGPSACGQIVVDRATSSVELPPGVGLDPGGLGKGLAADRVTALALRLGAAGAMAGLGGDLRCRGLAPSSAGWVVLARPADQEAGHRSSPCLAIADGGIATSTCLRRRWNTTAGPAHHLIDPVSGRSRPDAARQVTVVAATAAEAETLATALAAGDAIGTAPDGASDPRGEPELEQMIGGAGVLLTDHLDRQHRLGSIDSFLR